MRLGRLILIIFIIALLWGFFSGSAGFGERGETEASGSSMVVKAQRFMNLSAAVKERVAEQHGTYVSLEEIPLSLQQAVIATEDIRFYRHYGVDLEGVARAAFTNLQDGQFTEGGSTITQQLVKNLFLSQDKTISRKIEEVVLALGVEMRFSKDEILEMYLNKIYYGSGTYGVNAAAETYFGKQSKDLSLAEAAMLAGLPQAPSLYSPYVNFTAAKQRQAMVLDLMTRHGFISPGMAEKAKKEPLQLAK